MNDAKEILNQYRFKAKKAKQMEDEYDKFMTRATKVTASFDETSSHSNKISDKVGDNAIKLVEIREKWRTLWVDAERERLTIVDRINKLDEPYSTILMLRYVQEKKFEQIAFEMNYSYDWITHLHGEALDKFKNLYGENW